MLGRSSTEFAETRSQHGPGADLACVRRSAIECVLPGLPWSYADYCRRRQDPAFAPIDREATETDIEELRERLKTLGHVNLDSIEEEDELAQKNVDLKKHVEDIDAAMRQTDCDPTHIALALMPLNDEGVMDSVLPLLPLLGQLRIEVLEVE